MNHLKSKFQKKVHKKPIEKVPATFMGVNVNDEMVGEHEIPKKTKIHDDVILSNEEEEAVDVLPKDTFFSNITRKDAEIQTESCFAKMRWGEMEKNENEEDIYDDASKTIEIYEGLAEQMCKYQGQMLGRYTTHFFQNTELE